MKKKGKDFFNMNCKECTKFKTCEKARNPENYAIPECKDFKAEQGQMITMRDRLIELLMNTPKPQITVGGRTNGKTYQTAGNIADYLLANGVIAPKYKIGDKVWYITGVHRTIVKSAIVDEIIINCNGVSDLFVTSDTGSFENSVDIFYSTKEEAEQALKGGVSK